MQPTELLKKYDNSVLVELLEKMVLIRFFEEKVADLVEKREIITPAHLYIGQEAVAVGVCNALNDEDYLLSNHRGHGHYLAKGGSPLELMSEILCRETGCSRGRGGSMHIVAPEVGVLGTSSIVGGCIPLGVGAGLGAKMMNTKQLSVIFFGDGATDEGVFFESLNFAAIYNLPVLFVIENNHYASHLHLQLRQKNEKLSRFGDVFSVESKTVDGNNILEVYENALSAVDYIRNDNGPFLLECIVNRWRGHVGHRWDENIGLRSQEQIDEWIRNCPIATFQELLASGGILNNNDSDRIFERVRKQIEDITRESRAASKPPSDEVERFVYFEEGAK